MHSCTVVGLSSYIVSLQLLECVASTCQPAATASCAADVCAHASAGAGFCARNGQVRAADRRPGWPAGCRRAISAVHQLVSVGRDLRQDWAEGDKAVLYCCLSCLLGVCLGPGLLLARLYSLSASSRHRVRDNCILPRRLSLSLAACLRRPASCCTARAPPSLLRSWRASSQVHIT